MFYDPGTRRSDSRAGEGEVDRGRLHGREARIGWGKKSLKQNKNKKQNQSGARLKEALNSGLNHSTVLIALRELLKILMPGLS